MCIDLCIDCQWNDMILHYRYYRRERKNEASHEATSYKIIVDENSVSRPLLIQIDCFLYTLTTLSFFSYAAVQLSRSLFSSSSFCKSSFMLQFFWCKKSRIVLRGCVHTCNSLVHNEHLCKILFNILLLISFSAVMATVPTAIIDCKVLHININCQS